MTHFRFAYWSDPLCVWAFVGQARLDNLLRQFKLEVQVDYRVVPVFGSVHQRFRDGVWSKKGVDGRVAATKRIAEEHGHGNVSGEVWCY